MDEDFQELEATLMGMRPVTPDAGCMDRLLAAVERRAPAADATMERELSKLRPSALAGGVQERLLETVSRVPFPVNDKVVLFPGKAKPAATKAPARRPWLAAAAAVAVFGAFSALMLDGPGKGPGPVAHRSETASPALAPAPRGLIPASVGSQVSEAKDEGLTWTRDGKPMRQVKVIYMDKVKYAGEDGKVVEVERPRVEWLLVPEKID